MSKSIKKEIGQLIIAGFRGTSINDKSDIVKFIKNYNLAGVILYDEDLELRGPGSRNITSPSQLKQLVEDLQSQTEKSLLISVDQEGGEVHRLKSIYGFLETPSWNQIGSLNNELMTKQFSENMVKDLSGVGINLNFAPVIDLDYGKGYQYAHDHDLNFAEQEFLPQEISQTKLYEPGQNAKEEAIRSFLKKRWKEKYGY